MRNDLTQPLLGNNDNLEDEDEDDTEIIYENDSKNDKETLTYNDGYRINNIADAEVQFVNSAMNKIFDEQYILSDESYRGDILYDASKVHAFLKTSFIELSNLDKFQLYFWNPFAGVLFNVVFITYNWYETVTNNNDEAEIRLGKSLVKWIEFGGVLYLILISFYHYKWQKRYNLACDDFQTLGRWSTFKLFYTFRPKYIVFEYLSDVWKNNTFNFSKKLRNKAQQLINDLENNDGSGHNKEIVKALKAARELQLVINRDEQEKQDKQRAFYKRWHWKSAKQAFAGTFLIFLLSICLILGMIALILKLSQLDFIGDTALRQWNFQNWYTFLGFCNQIWNMSNENQSVINGIFKFLYMDNVNFRVTRESCYKIMKLESVIKMSLVKFHGIRGFLIGSSLNVTLVGKILKKPAKDVEISKLKDYCQKFNQYAFQLKQQQRNQRLETRNPSEWSNLIFEQNEICKIRCTFIVKCFKTCKTMVLRILHQTMYLQLGTFESLKLGFYQSHMINEMYVSMNPLSHGAFLFHFILGKFWSSFRRFLAIYWSVSVVLGIIALTCFYNIDKYDIVEQCNFSDSTVGRYFFISNDIITTFWYANVVHCIGLNSLFLIILLVYWKLSLANDNNRMIAVRSATNSERSQFRSYNYDINYNYQSRKSSVTSLNSITKSELSNMKFNNDKCRDNTLKFKYVLYLISQFFTAWISSKVLMLTFSQLLSNQNGETGELSNCWQYMLNHRQMYLLMVSMSFTYGIGAITVVVEIFAAVLFFLSAFINIYAIINLLWNIFIGILITLFVLVIVTALIIWIIADIVISYNLTTKIQNMNLWQWQLIVDNYNNNGGMTACDWTLIFPWCIFTLYVMSFIFGILKCILTVYCYKNKIKHRSTLKFVHFTRILNNYIIHAIIVIVNIAQQIILRWFYNVHNNKSLNNQMSCPHFVNQKIALFGGWSIWFAICDIFIVVVIWKFVKRERFDLLLDWMTFRMIFPLQLLMYCCILLATFIPKIFHIIEQIEQAHKYSLPNYQLEREIVEMSQYKTQDVKK